MDVHMRLGVSVNTMSTRYTPAAPGAPAESNPWKSPVTKYVSFAFAPPPTPV